MHSASEREVLESVFSNPKSSVLSLQPKKMQAVVFLAVVACALAQPPTPPRPVIPEEFTAVVSRNIFLELRTGSTQSHYGANHFNSKPSWT